MLLNLLSIMSSRISQSHNNMLNILVLIGTLLSTINGQTRESDCTDRRGNRHSLGETWTHNCVTYRCDGYGAYTPTALGCKDSKGQCRPLGTTWRTGCNEFVCMETKTVTQHRIYPHPNRKACMYKGQCKEVGLSWNEGCITYSCLDSQFGAYFKAMRAACRTQQGKCIPVGRTWKHGCVTFSCIQDNEFIRSKISSGGCQGSNGQCHQEYSKWTDATTCAELTCTKRSNGARHTYRVVLQKQACKDDVTNRCFPLYSRNLKKRINGQIYQQCECYPSGAEMVEYRCRRYQYGMSGGQVITRVGGFGRTTTRTVEFRGATQTGVQGGVQTGTRQVNRGTRRRVTGGRVITGGTTRIETHVKNPYRTRNTATGTRTIVRGSTVVQQPGGIQFVQGTDGRKIFRGPNAVQSKPQSKQPFTSRLTGTAGQVAPHSYPSTIQTIPLPGGQQLTVETGPNGSRIISRTTEKISSGGRKTHISTRTRVTGGSFVIPGQTNIQRTETRTFNIPGQTQVQQTQVQQTHTGPF